MPKRQKINNQKSLQQKKPVFYSRHILTGDQIYQEQARNKHFTTQRSEVYPLSRGRSKKSANKNPRRKRKQREQANRYQQASNSQGQNSDNIDANEAPQFQTKKQQKKRGRKPKVMEYTNEERLIPKILKSLNQQVPSLHQLIVPHCESYDLKVSDLLGRSSIFQGTSCVGKRCAAHYIVNLQNSQVYDQTQVKGTRKQGQLTYLIDLNCNVHTTETQFIKKLTMEIGAALGNRQIDKRIALVQNIDLKKLNTLFKKKKQKVIILIRYAERLLDTKKQTILYTLMEWVKTQVRQQVGIIFSSHVFNLLEKFEKRVKSRFNGKIYYFFHPKVPQIINIIHKRLQTVEIDTKRKQKILQAVSNKNNLMVKQLASVFNGLPRGIDYYLKIFRVSFALYTEKQFQQMNPKQFIQDLPVKFQQSLKYVNPILTQHNPMVQTCSVPELIFLALMRNMIINQRYPLNLVRIWEVYNEKRSKYLQASLHEKSSAICFDSPIAQKVVKKLKDNGLIIMNDLKDNIWLMQINVRINCETIYASIKNIKNLPYFVLQILDD